MPLRSIPVIVDSLPSEGEALSLRFDAAEVDAALAEAGCEGSQAAAPLVAEVRVLRSGEDVFALGKIETRVRCHCGRCLGTFEQPIGAEFHVTFAPDPEPEGGERELHREDLDLEPLRAGTLDLAQVIREQLLLALPTHPVCREDCRGLCPGCGVDRNVSPCGCRVETSSPHFAALASWGRNRGS